SRQAGADLLGPSPGQQFVELLHRPAIDELGEDVGEVGLWIEAVKLRGLDERSQARPVGCALIVACKQAVLSVECDRPDGPPDDVGVHLDAAVLEEAYETVPVIEPVADRFGDGALLRDGDEPGLEPSLEVLDQWLRLGLSDGAALFGAAPADPALDGVERRDPF